MTLRFVKRAFWSLVHFQNKSKFGTYGSQLINSTLRVEIDIEIHAALPESVVLNAPWSLLFNLLGHRWQTDGGLGPVRGTQEGGASFLLLLRSGAKQQHHVPDHVAWMYRDLC